MAFNELEERISKIRQQNEEIKRRYEEVEEDKKNAAKLNALVQMVPSTDWPERKEPPEYSSPPKPPQKQKSVTKEQSEHAQQHHPNDRKKGEGPPPDPKYNFLADAEREEYGVPNTRENTGNKNHNRSVRGNFKKRGMGREGQQRGRMYHGTHRDEHKPEYEAWRKERNRIDEDRISRQKTAEGNWRREWDNDKAHLANEKAEGKVPLGDYTKKDHKEGRYSDGGGYTSHNRGAYHKSYRGSPRNFHNNHDYHHANSYDQHNHDMSSISPSADERTVIATDKSIKVMLNQNNMTKGPVMSVKVNSPSIAGTGRVGPRQRTRVTYSSHSDMDANAYEGGSFTRQKSFEDKSKGNHYNNMQRTPSLRRPQSQKKKENGAKSPYLQRKEFRKDPTSANSSKHYENGSQQNFVRKDYKDAQKFHYPPKSPRASHKNLKTPREDSANPMEEKKVVILKHADSEESQKVDEESRDVEEKAEESEEGPMLVEKRGASDNEETDDVVFENSECVPCDVEMHDEEKIEESYSNEVTSALDRDSVSVPEDDADDKKMEEERNEDDSAVSTQERNVEMVDVEDATDEKKEIDGSVATIDDAPADSCASDNNPSAFDKKVELREEFASVEDACNDEKTPLEEEQSNKDEQDDDVIVVVSTNPEKSSEMIVEASAEASPIDAHAHVQSDEATRGNNEDKVPLEENVLHVDNINDKSTVDNSEETSSRRDDDETSQQRSQAFDEVKNEREETAKVSEVLENTESRVESSGDSGADEKKRIESEEVTRGNSEN